MFTSTTKVILTTLAAAATAVVIVGGTVTAIDRFSTAKRKKRIEAGEEEPEFISEIKQELRDIIEHATDVTERVIKSVNEITASDYADAMLEANKLISAAHVRVAKLREVNARNTEKMIENVRKLDVLFLDIVERFDALSKDEPVGELSSKKMADLALVKKRGEAKMKQMAAEKAASGVPEANVIADQTTETEEAAPLIVEAEILADEVSAGNSTAPAQQS